MEVRILLAPPLLCQAVDDAAASRVRGARAAVDPAVHTDDETFMREALEQARAAERRGEVPVGAVVVCDGRVIARGYNLRELTQDPTSHAEMIALRKAAARLGTWRLSGASVYVTLEPCPMCAGALVNARVDRVVWGCDDPKAGATRSLYTIGADARLNHRFVMQGGVLADECASRLTGFFSRIRAEGRK